MSNLGSIGLKLSLNFVISAMDGYKNTPKEWLIIGCILISITSYFLTNYFDSVIITLLGEDYSSLDHTKLHLIQNNYDSGRTISFDFKLNSKSVISFIYSPIILIVALGQKSFRHKLVCFSSCYLCLLIFITLNNFADFQLLFAHEHGVYYYLLILQYALFILIIGILFSNITFSKLNKGWIGLILSIIFFSGFVILYRLLNRSVKLYDVLIFFSTSFLIVNFYFLRISLSRRRQKNYDVFISYRRDKNIETAKLIRRELISRNIKAFQDIEDLGPKYYDEKLIDIIQHTKNFILLISPNDLKECFDKKDWLRKEIITAFESKSNIIPVLKDGVKWEELSPLPEEIVDLPRHSSILYSSEYFDAMIMKLISFLDI